MEWITPKRGHSNSRSQLSYSFRVSNQLGGGSGKKQAVIALSEKTMKSLRWVVGDRVAVAFEKNTVHLKRVHKDGFALSSGTGKKKEEVVGKMTAATFKTGAFLFPQDNVVHIDEFIVQDEIVIFSIK